MPRGRGKREEAGTPFKPAGLPAPLAEEVDRFIAARPGAGWTSRSAFAAEACRFYMRAVVRHEYQEAMLQGRRAPSGKPKDFSGEGPSDGPSSETGTREG